MKRETILKVLIVLIIGAVLLAKPINIFAVTGDQANLDDFMENQGSLEDLEPEPPATTTPEPTTPEPATPSTTTTPETTKPSANTNTDIPKAGLVEDTMLVVSIVALIAIAIFASKKVNDYKNI